MFNVEDYTIIAHWFPRWLGAIYLCAFWPFLFQIKGLIGDNGILPTSSYLNLIAKLRPKDKYSIAPTLFWFRSDNRALMSVVVAGVICSILLLLGIYPPLMIALLWVLYFSIISAGQDFLGFGWEMFLQEVALNTFLLSLSDVPNIMVWLSINFLLFRFHVQSGAVKFQSKDPNWKNLSAVAYHYQSQPIPNATAWYVYKLPMWFHKFSCWMMFFIELVVPFFLFFSEDIRLAVCALFVGLQLFIYATGNFSYLNHMTAIFSLILLNNTFLERIGFSLPEVSSTPNLALTLAGSILFGLQLLRFWDHFFPSRAIHKLLSTFSSCHICNRYGIFAIMTCTRYEVVVEGSDDGATWQQYDFYHKPTDLKRRPTRISPYQPRLDWQAWFLPFRAFADEEWFQNFLTRLLEGTPDVLKLLRHNPFSEKPPKYIRAMMYIYEFTTFEEKKNTGLWWKRTLVGPYSPSFSLRTKPQP
ncbi:MAG: lipase maturation factor family protein [Verrucomicrobia bacterium]|nr:lipase maturation factor family protein [Verrucomicrobiota bacterium]